MNYYAGIEDDLYYEKAGDQSSLFENVKWRQRETGVDYTPMYSGSITMIPIGGHQYKTYKKDAFDINESSNPTFNNTSLSSLKTLSGGSFLDDGFWSADFIEDTNGRLALRNGTVSQKMGGHTHAHPVFKSIDFKNIIVELEFKKTSGGKQKVKLYLDQDSQEGTQSPNLKIPAVPNDKATVRRYVGTNGTFRNNDDYQIGLSQTMYYTLKCGTKFLALDLELSMVFMYPKNDFEPGGNIKASKVFPQIKFYSGAYTNISPEQTGLYDITPHLPANLVLDSAEIINYKARTKIVVNNNSTHHYSDLEPFPYNPEGIQYDPNYFGTLRENVQLPNIFEKIFLPGWETRNTVGLYTDSNVGTLDSTGASDKRMKPPYKLDVVTTLIGEIGIKPQPFWYNVFDYTNYGLTNEKEIIGVYGYEKASSAFAKFLSRQTDFVYPSNTTLNPANKKITLSKVGRQGAYDNIHLHGYLGHYLSDNVNYTPLVIHAPVCGYCCFHMHWRWSAFNYEVADNWPFQAGNHGLLYSAETSHYLGWGTDKDGKYQAHQKNGKGLPLTSPFIHLTIAATHPSATPYSESGAVTPTNQTALHTDEKAIWYCTSITNHDFNDSHVTMEHGCGYAFDYHEDANGISSTTSSTAGGIAGGANPPKAFRNILSQILPSGYDDFLDTVCEVIYDPFSGNTMYQCHASTPEMYEVLYRLMHYFNTNDGLQSYPQVPSQNNVAGDVRNYANLAAMENL